MKLNLFQAYLLLFCFLVPRPFLQPSSFFCWLFLSQRSVGRLHQLQTQRPVGLKWGSPFQGHWMDAERRGQKKELGFQNVFFFRLFFFHLVAINPGDYCIHTGTHVNISIHTCMYTYTCTQTHKQIHTHHTHPLTHTHTNAHAHARTHTHTHTHTR